MAASLSPEQVSAAEFLALWRGHWGNETRLRYERDVTLGGDAYRVRNGHAPPARAHVRHMVISLVRVAGGANVAAALCRSLHIPSKLSLPSALSTHQTEILWQQLA